MDRTGIVRRVLELNCKRMTKTKMVPGWWEASKNEGRAGIS
jgi:hypothetical protein